VAVGLQSISQDSFAMPEMWINLGMLAGMTAFALESNNNFLTPSSLSIAAGEEQEPQ